MIRQGPGCFRHSNRETAGLPWLELPLASAVTALVDEKTLCLQFYRARQGRVGLFQPLWFLHEQFPINMPF